MNREHVKIVKRGWIAIIEWREENHYERLDLRGADLSGADLHWVDLHWAYLNDARLTWANLDEANLNGAEMFLADLSYASLYRANLSGARMRGADLNAANLSGADLSTADLSMAKLTRVSLRGANLSNADLRGADLTEASWDYNTIGIAPAPEGELIGWGKKHFHIVKMLIPAEARRSCATSRKHRAEYVKTLEIDDGAATRLIYDNYYETTVYEVGKITRADGWDEDRWNECGQGIHFFLTRNEAEQW